MKFRTSLCFIKICYLCKMQKNESVKLLCASSLEYLLLTAQHCLSAVWTRQQIWMQSGTPSSAMLCLFFCQTCLFSVFCKTFGKICWKTFFFLSTNILDFGIFISGLYKWDIIGMRFNSKLEIKLICVYFKHIARM